MQSYINIAYYESNNTHITVFGKFHQREMYAGFARKHHDRLDRFSREIPNAYDCAANADNDCGVDG